VASLPAHSRMMVSVTDTNGGISNCSMVMSVPLSPGLHRDGRARRLQLV
jgi:hypothetical protein